MSALDDLQAVMFEWAKRESMIKPTLHRRGNGPNYWYRLQLVEEFDDGESSRFHYRQFDNCVAWVEEKLKDWPDCKRKAFDMWDFRRRRDAEKFLTIFHLSWVQ